MSETNVLRETVAAAIPDQSFISSDTWEECNEIQRNRRRDLANAILAALRLDDLDGFADRVLDGLPLGEAAFPAVRRNRVRRALEAALHTDPDAHNWLASGSFDTGHQPPRQRWDCSHCECVEWTADPEGPSELQTAPSEPKDLDMEDFDARR